MLPAPPARSPRVLILEPDAASATLLVDALGVEAFELAQVASAEALEAALASEPCHAVVLGGEVGGDADALACLRALRARADGLRWLPAVLLLGRPLDARARLGVVDARTRVVDKPFHLGALRQAVREVIEAGALASLEPTP